MNPQRLNARFLLPFFFVVGCYAHQGKRADSSNLISDAQTACLRNDPNAAKAFLQRQIRQDDSSSDFKIAQTSLQARSVCVALQSMIDKRASDQFTGRR